VGSLHTTTGVVVSDSNSDVGGGEGGQAEESAGVARGGAAGGGDYAGGQGLHDWTRRRRGVVSAAALAMLSAFCSNCPSSHAFSLGISGPKEWLKGQKQKTAKFLFAPINASRDRLDSALLLLSGADGSSFGDYEEAGKLVKVAARDCMPAQPGSITEIQTRTGVEVCTFRLVLKNAASLLDKDDPLKVNADAALDALIRSFVALDRLLADGAAGATSRRENVMGALKETTVALDSFERGVRNCLGIA